MLDFVNKRSFKYNSATRFLMGHDVQLVDGNHQNTITIYVYVNDSSRPIKNQNEAPILKEWMISWLHQELRRSNLKPTHGEYERLMLAIDVSLGRFLKRLEKGRETGQVEILSNGSNLEKILLGKDSLITKVVENYRTRPREFK